MNHRRAGFSLVEIMVTTVLALLLLVGIGRIFVNSKQGYRVQESAGRLQENIRITSDYLSRYIRMADFWGGVKARDIGILGSSSYPGPGDCEDGWIVNTPPAGLVGYQGGATAPASLPAGCISDYVPNSDALAIRYVNPDAYINTATLSAGGASVERNGIFYLRTLVGQRALLFNVRNQRSAAISAIPGGDVSGVLNYQFQTVLFYLKTNNFGLGPVPTLMMLKLESDMLEAEPLVDGIEALAFEYGVDTNSDLLVDRYQNASAVTQWSQVLSVRASFVARGDELDTYTDTTSYPIASDRCYGPASSNCAMKYSLTDARYQRRLVVREIQLRNRVRG